LRVSAVHEVMIAPQGLPVKMPMIGLSILTPWSLQGGIFETPDSRLQRFKTKNDGQMDLLWDSTHELHGDVPFAGKKALKNPAFVCKKSVSSTSLVSETPLQMGDQQFIKSS
ncbi:hypothetical protein MKW98_030616, partial [Papaver atlanticum]